MENEMYFDVLSQFIKFFHVNFFLFWSKFVVVKFFQKFQIHVFQGFLVCGL